MSVPVGRNPNVSAALIVELGTEDIEAEVVADRIAAGGTATETLSILEAGGTAGALSAGADRPVRLNDEAERAKREEANVSELVFGVSRRQVYLPQPGFSRTCARQS